MFNLDPAIETELDQAADSLGISPLIWRNMLESVASGNCLIILGPQAALAANDKDLADELLLRKLKQHRKASGLASPHDWRHLCSYLLDQERIKDEVKLMVNSFYKNMETSCVTSALHRSLAALPLPLYATTTPDPLLENALRAVVPQKTPTHCTYSTHGIEGEKNLEDASSRSPCIMYLQGRWEKPGTLLLTPAEMVDYTIKLVREKQPLPSRFTEKLRDSSGNTAIIFLGFGFHHWQTRLFLRVFFEGLGSTASRTASEQRNAFPTSAALEEVRHYFDKQGVYIEPGDPVVFAQELLRCYQKLPLPAAAPRDREAKQNFIMEFLMENYQGQDFEQKLRPYFPDFWTSHTTPETPPAKQYVQFLPWLGSNRLFGALIDRFVSDYPDRANGPEFFKAG